MNDAEKDLIAAAVCDSITACNEFYCAFGDGENDPDVEAWPVALRTEGTDQLVFNESFAFELGPFLQKLNVIVGHPVELKHIQIMYDENGMDIFFHDDSDTKIWISILRKPPLDAPVVGALTKSGSVIFYDPAPHKN